MSRENLLMLLAEQTGVIQRVNPDDIFNLSLLMLPKE